MIHKSKFAVPFILLAFSSACWAGTRPLKEDTAVTIIVGPFLDSNGTPQTSLTVANIDCNLYKNNGTKVDVALAASGTSNDCVHVEDGYYSLELTATDTSTPGYLRISFQISGAMILHEDFTVEPANIYNSWYSTDKLQVNVSQISGDQVAADNAESFFDGTGYGPLIVRGAISSVESSTHFYVTTAGGIIGWSADSLNGCQVLLQRFTGGVPDGRTSLRTIIDSADDGGGALVLTIESAPDFTLAAGDVVTVLPPSFAGADRADLDAVLVDTSTTLDDLVDDLESRLTAMRAGYLDNLNIGGNVASAAALAVVDDFVDTEVNAIKTKTDQLTFTVANRLDANTLNWAGVATASDDIALLAQLGSGNFAAGAISAAAMADGAIDRATFAADTGMQSVRSGTAQSGSTTSIGLDASASSVTDFYNHDYVYVTSGAGAGQYRLITAYNGTTKAATVTPAWITGQEPASGSTFAILPAGIANVEAWFGWPVVVPTVPGVPEVDVTHVSGEQVCD
jgi:hypothetical protein